MLIVSRSMEARACVRMIGRTHLQMKQQKEMLTAAAVSICSSLVCVDNNFFVVLLFVIVKETPVQKTGVHFLQHLLLQIQRVS